MSGIVVFFSLTLNRQMLAGIYCIHIYRSSDQEMFFKKGVPRICSQFTGEHLCKRVISTLLKSHFCKCIVLYLYCRSATERLFLENTSGELFLYIVLNIEITNVEILSKQLKNYLKHKYFKQLFNFIHDFRLVAKG